MLRWEDPDRLNQYRYHNCTKKVTTEPTKFDRVVLYVTLFLAVVALLLPIGFHIF